MIKVIHLKSQTSVALPIYTSDMSHLTLVEEARLKALNEKVSITLTMDTGLDLSNDAASTVTPLLSDVTVMRPITQGWRSRELFLLRIVENYFS